LASCYVYSGAAGAGTGADWANAYTTLTLAIAGQAAGDTYYVAHDHAESTAAAITLAFKGTGATPDRILCVNRAGTVPPVAADLLTTAQVTTTGTSNISMTGSYYMEGLIFNTGTGAGASSLSLSASGTHRLCQFKLVSTGAGTITNQSTGIALVMLTDCTMSFSAVGQMIAPSQGGFFWTNSAATAALAGAAVPTTLFTLASSACQIVCSGLDLSAAGAGKTLIAASFRFAGTKLVNCEIGASVTVAVAPVGIGASQDMIACNSTTNAARNERYRYQGTLTTETTIVRTGGASDGTTAYSWKIATTANNERDFPFETFEGALWNSTTGSSKTLTVHTVTDNVTLTDAEIWLEVEYLGSSATPVTTLITDANATVLTTAANQATSTEAWTTTGLATPVYQKLSVTFTPEMAGPIRWRVKVAKASTTVYICPKAELA
jgi:hypothetical protein